MPAPPARDVTALLLAWGHGNHAALDELVPVVYAELRRLARRSMRDQRRGHTLQTTALVHEAYLRLVDLDRVRWQNRAHFLAVAARLMRRVLVDAARARGALKRGGVVHPVTLDEQAVGRPASGPDLLALDEALTALAAVDPRKEQVVELRYFAGLSVEETARVLGVSVDTVMRDWKMVKLWLVHELGPVGTEARPTRVGQPSSRTRASTRCPASAVPRGAGTEVTGTLTEARMGRLAFRIKF